MAIELTIQLMLLELELLLRQRQHETALAVIAGVGSLISAVITVAFGVIALYA